MCFSWYVTTPLHPLNVQLLGKHSTYLTELKERHKQYASYTRDSNRSVRQIAHDYKNN